MADTGRGISPGPVRLVLVRALPPIPRSTERVTTPDYRLTQLETLEAESIHVIREVAAELERPVLLFSGGKDSIVMLELARKAFAPARSSASR